MVIDHENLFGTEHSGAGCTQQADRTCAIDGDARAVADAGVGHGLEGGRQDVRKEQHLLVGQGARDFERPGVGFGHTHVFRLAARDAAIHVAEPKQRGTRWNGFLVEDRATPRVGLFTGGEQIHLAEKAAAASDNEGDHHSVAGLHGSDGRARFFNDAHELMTEDIAMLDGRDLPAIQMQVRTTDCRGGDAKDDVVAVLDNRIGDGVDFDAMRAVIGECSHDVLPLSWV
ncbi:hypothetical protein D3C76_565330 [compost metagenome]